jgi:hypothetical protein
MGWGRPVGAIVVAVAVLFLVPAPARADRPPGCTLTAQGAVYCDRNDDAPVRVGVTGKVVQLVAAGDSTCALTEPGEVYCWGGGHGGRIPRSPLLLVAIGFFLLAAGSILVLAGRLPAGGDGVASAAGGG